MSMLTQNFLAAVYECCVDSDIVIRTVTADGYEWSGSENTMKLSCDRRTKMPPPKILSPWCTHTFSQLFIQPLMGGLQCRGSADVMKVPTS